MPKLTETFLRRTPQSKDGTRKFWDTEIKGFVLFVGKRTKTWYFQKDIGGQTKRILIGRYPLISVDAARQTAMEFALDLTRGAGKHAQFGAPSVEDALEAYLARPKLRSDVHKSNVRQQFKSHLRDWLRLPLNEITRSMVAERHRSMARIPSGANHLLRQFRSVWNHARRTHDLAEAPTIAIEWYPEAPSGEIIEDFTAWADTVSEIDNPIHRAYFWFLLFTGLRKSEALKLEWQNIHQDHLHLPITKNGRSFDLPLTDVHHEILGPLRSLSRTWVFPSPKGPNGHMTNPTRIQWSAHTHRRTFATVAMEGGLLEETVGRLLNHTPASITGRRYIRSSVELLQPAMVSTCDALTAKLPIWSLREQSGAILERSR